MLEARLVSSLEKVGTGQEPGALDGEAPLYALRGETVSFQIAFRDTSVGKTESTGICVGSYVDALAEAGGMEVRIRQVLPVWCGRSCDPGSVDEGYLFTDSRNAPDLLTDIGGGEEVPVTGEWQSFWIDITPGETQTAGCCTIFFTIRQKGGETAENEISVKVHVIDAALPKLSIPHTEWFHCDGIADYYGVDVFTEEFWRIFRNFLTVYVKRGCNTIFTPVVTPPLDTGVGLERTTVQLVGVELAEGQYKLDFTELERFLDICLESGIEYFEICHLFTQWGAEAAPKVEARVDGVRRRIFGWETPSDDSEYLRFLGELLPALKEALDRRGLLPRTFFHISDEPNLDSVHYQAAQSTVRRLLEGCVVIEAVSDYAYCEKGIVDIPVCATNHIEPFLEKRPPRLWSYYCCSQTVEVPNRFISMPSWRNRIYGVLLYWHRMDGFLHWGFNFYNSALSRRHIDPYETVDADGCFPAGDPFLVYPGRDGVPEESIRLMVQEEGINDYRALCMLETRIGRERVMELIRQEAGMELSFRRYPGNAEFLLRLREKVNRLLG